MGNLYFYEFSAIFVVKIQFPLTQTKIPNMNNGHFVVLATLFLLITIGCQKETTPANQDNTNANPPSLNLPLPQDSVACNCSHDPNPMGAFLQHPHYYSFSIGDQHVFDWQWVIKNDVVNRGQGGFQGMYCDFDPTIVHVDSMGVFTALSEGQTTIQVCQYNQRQILTIDVTL